MQFCGLVFGVWGLGLEVCGLGLRVWGVGCGVRDLGLGGCLARNEREEGERRLDVPDSLRRPGYEQRLVVGAVVVREIEVEGFVGAHALAGEPHADLLLGFGVWGLCLGFVFEV